jgi:DNA-directed RNA polymerase specialized sigma24 family protein
LTVDDNKASETDAGKAFSRHGGKIFRYLLRRIGNRHDAEELTQRVFTDVTAALARL